MMHALTHMTNVIASEWQARVDKEIEKNEEKSRTSFQNNKLIQMGEMIGMIAHQWRQPLNAISATGINLSLLSSMGKLEPQKVQQSSEFIQNQCQKMSKTIDTFMNFVKPAKESKAFKLSHMIGAIMEIMGTQLTNHNIKVNIQVVNKNISMVGYEDLLEQVIINLLANARDAFDDLEKATKYIDITIDMIENVPVVIIEDNAGGIAENIRERIFNPYFTTKEQGKGTGIGLYMSMDIMKQSFNGNIVYKNIENGSRFEVFCGHVDGWGSY
jgi:C4-dicarboxylate-specific signal transduction histidine kinase